MKEPFVPILLLFAAALAPAAAADPWADRVVEYVPGAGVPRVFGSDPPEFFDLESAAVGSPSRTSGGFVVSPFSGPFTRDDVVSVGRGGSLTVAFDEPVTDDPRNPFGIDLLVFGNAFYLLSSFTAEATVTGASAEGGVISVSEDGVTFFDIPGVGADGLFPTNGFADSTDFFPAAPGGVLSDFTLPVDPSYNPVGDTAAQVYAAYAGSGGGAGIDLASVGLAQARYVRVTVAANAAFVPEIDAFADVRAVPEPAAASLVGLAMLAVGRRRP